ncbi:MAG TPA: beta-methylgalactoside transporter [Lachnospiraceae bacterium]|jgi:methyl-galactoside transport system permease protein|nr:beta-methylgalactoside transporter [Lachnospiraceae bacterium]HBY72083.1 beta-methylgalactoside transporter [Lachnospiraceae bacterium]HCA70750.1 beta-methylgalactoside transporter [Lachnospiraceae bacterium]HCM13503.1 beta-methylgalactoside transporter [Lachnospiraceae bacterium]HCR40411.1 beta-methylgalactoside transporter [Lachnospiraceae bacterium]
MEKSSRINKKSVIRFIQNNAIIIIMLIIATVVGILEPNFISKSNFKNLSVNTATRFIIALGVSGCLITKGTDLSAGRLVGLGACISATLLQKPDYAGRMFPNLPVFFPNYPFLWIIIVFLITIAICAVFGFANGAIISFLKVPPFIATLGMQTLVYGLCLVYTGAQPIGGLRGDYTSIASGSFFKGKLIEIPYLLVIATICGALMWVLYNKTRHGKYMYAIGGNENAAEVAGVNTNKTKIIIYTLAAAFYALGGTLLAAKAGGTSVNMGAGYELEAIAACTIGGVSTNGGVGKISGILIGVVVFELLKISMQFLGVETNYTYIVQGLVIIIAVALDLRKYLAKK